MIIKKAVKGKLPDFPEEKARRDRASKIKYENDYKKITIRVSPSDYNNLKKEAEKLEVSIPRLICITMLDSERKHFKPKIDMDMKADINQIYGNFKEIERRIKMLGEHAIFDDMFDTLKVLNDKLDKIYFKI